LILFAAYAALIWFAALRFRRRWQGFVIVVTGGLLTWFVMKALEAIGVGGGGFSLLLMGETAIIVAVGLFICVLPRKPDFAHCHFCEYDFRGLDSQDGRFVCPECGNPPDGWASVRKRRAAAFAAMPATIAPLNGVNVAMAVRAEAAALAERTDGGTDGQAAGAPEARPH